MAMFKSTNNFELSVTERNHLSFGIIFGLLFPIVTLILDVWTRGLNGLPNDLSSTFFSTTTHALALLSPLIMGRIFLEIGRRQDQLEKQLARVNQTEILMRHQAHHDTLTGLCNRAKLMTTMEEGIATGQWKVLNTTLFLLDLDDFKLINDTYGHDAGDKVLQNVARRLREMAFSRDCVVRLGGDEFLIVHFPQDGIPDTADFAEKIMATVSREIQLVNNLVIPHVSVGVSRVGYDGENLSDVLRSADMALYAAKKEPVSACRSFTAEMKSANDAQTKLQKDMTIALGKGQFELYYQPIHGTTTKRLRSFEALLRWNHPEKGLISPLDFIPAAEKSGFIVELGRFVLFQACETAVKFPKPIGISVNLSPVQFKDQNLVTYVKDALESSGLAPGRLDLEITESLLLEPSPRILEMIDALRELGVRITIDDFGTGFSSLNNLRNFNFDRLKIDRSFTMGVTTNVQDAEIVRTILSLSKTLKMETVIEGVETEAQLSFACEEGATEVQGFYYSKPVPEAEAWNMLAELGQIAQKTNSSDTRAA